ncbi:amidase family protein [Geodermatophilus sp. SYSU D00708]
MTAAMAGVLLVLSGAVAVPSSGADPVPGTTGPAVVAPSLGGLDLDAATIPEIQSRIDAGDFTAVELTQAYLARIAELDDVLGSVLFVNPNAVAEAAASDQVRRESGARSPLEGIPVLLKDNVDTADMPTTAGSRALLGSRPDDATITRELREAGAVLLGKANLSEWANFRGHDATSGWSAVGGQTNSPHVLDRNPNGSSSGSAVAVAASLTQVAIGTETDGSIVSPAGATGVVGLKPTLGLVSRTGVVPISAEQDTAGPIARHVVDAALLVQVISGPDPADPATLAAPRRELRGAEPEDDALEGARIGVLTLTPEESVAVDDATEAVFGTAIKSIEAAGATPIPVRLANQAEIDEGEFPALLAEFHRDINAYLAATPGDHPADLAGLIAFNRQDSLELVPFDQETFEQAQAAAVPADDPAVRELRDTIRTSARASIDDALAQGPGPEDDLEAIVALTNTPGWVTRYEHIDGIGDAFGYESSTPAAVAGYPSVTVPAGFAGPQEALPIGISFIGSRWEDAAVLDLALDFESEVGARRAPEFLPTVGD